MTAALHAPDRSRLDFETVAAAALAIAGRGELISATAVLREVGRGSMTTVTKHLKEWAANAMPVMAGKATAPKWTARELEGMALLRKVFREEAATALAGARADAEEEVRLAREAVATAQEQARLADAARQRAEERAAGLETGMAVLNEQLASGAREREAQNAQIARLHALNGEQTRQYEQTVGELRTQVSDAVARYEGMQKHMLLQIEQARGAGADAKRRLEEDLGLANARAQRATLDLDRVRGEREGFESRATKAEAQLVEALAGRGEAERRLAVAEGQVATLIDKTDRLSSAQAEATQQLVAAQREAAGAGAALRKLERTAENLLAAIPEAGETLTKAGQAKLSKAVAGMRALLPAS